MEPSAHLAAPPFKKALMDDGIPFASFQVDDVKAECGRLSDLGVEFIQELIEADDYSMAILNDTCGNLIQIIELKQ